MRPRKYEEPKSISCKIEMWQYSLIRLKKMQFSDIFQEGFKKTFPKIPKEESIEIVKQYKKYLQTKMRKVQIGIDDIDRTLERMNVDQSVVLKRIFKKVLKNAPELPTVEWLKEKKKEIEKQCGFPVSMSQIYDYCNFAVNNAPK